MQRERLQFDKEQATARRTETEVMSKTLQALAAVMAKIVDKDV